MRGGQHQVLLLMRELRRAGHDSILLARDSGPLRRAGSDLGFITYPATLTRVSRHSSEVDMVHAHDARAHTLAAIACRRPFVVSRRVAFPVRRSVASAWKYGRAARFLAISRFVARQLQNASIPAAKIDVVYDAVEPVQALSVWDPGSPAVALASSDPQKGRDLVQRAAAMAGIPVNFSNDLARDFLHASMFVYITRSEGLGSAALLAMAMGVPVIASCVGGLPEVFVDDESGMFVRNDCEEIARAMRKLIENRGLAQHLIESGKRRVAECFAPEQLLCGTVASYRRALAA